MLIHLRCRSLTHDPLLANDAFKGSNATFTESLPRKMSDAEFFPSAAKLNPLFWSSVNALRVPTAFAFESVNVALNPVDAAIVCREHAHECAFLGLPRRWGCRDAGNREVRC